MPVPLSAIRRWLDDTGVRDPYVRRHFIAVMMAVDAITLRRANEKSKPGANKPTPETKSPARRRPKRIRK